VTAMQHALTIVRAGKLERIPFDRLDGNILDLSTHWAAEQSAVMMTAPAEARKETARLLTEISLELESVRDAIKLAISADLIEEALCALEELRDMTFAGAPHAAPIVRTAFATRCTEIVRELHGLLCAAYEKLTGRRVDIARRA